MAWASTGAAASLTGVVDILDVRSPGVLDAPAPVRAAWQRWRLPALVTASDGDVLFAPGGTVASGFDIPTVTVFQNMLPFDGVERARYGWSWMRLRLEALARLQRRSFAASDAVICLTEHARQTLEEEIPSVRGRTEVIPHGVDGRFFQIDRPADGGAADPGSKDEDAVRLLYLSIVDVYKHQPEVAEAALRLAGAGRNVHLELVGPAYGPALRRLERALDRIDPHRQRVSYRGPVDYDRVHEVYAGADLFVFASTCENLPIILLEAMAAGLPIACSEHAPMPDVLGDAGVYFDPEDPDSIAGAVADLVDDPERARSLGRKARERARGYDWKECARSTFDLLASVAGAPDAMPGRETT